MNKRLVMWGTFVLVFLLSILGSYKFINRNNQDMTIELGAPTLPLVSMVIKEAEYNTLHGYTGKVDVSDVAEYLCPVGEDRTITGKIQTFGTEIKAVAYEVRNNDGMRLIENGPIFWEEKKNDILDFAVTMKDLIVAGDEYIFGIVLETVNHDEIHYYTRFIYGETFDLDNQLDFVRDFHQNTLQKERISEIKPFMETDNSQDNKSLAYVNIHSAAKQVVWDELQVTRVTEPDIFITYLQDNYGAYMLDYYITSKVEGNQEYYHVVEKFLVSSYNDKMYLLDYERTADQMFDYEAEVYQNDKINLSIQSKDIPVKESEDGNMAAFVVNSSLYYYDDVENKIYHVYGFFDGMNDDERSMYLQHDIKVLQVGEAGSMYFMVYGYMNRGSYEGRNGIVLYFYNGQTKLVEEIGFCESSRSASYVMAEIEKLSFMGRTEQIYFCMEGNIWCYDLTDGKLTTKISWQEAEQMFVSGDHSCIVIKKKDGVYFLNLEDNTSLQLGAGESGEIVPQGFIGNDFVYGISAREDWILQSDGSYARYMKELCIQNAEGEIKKQYRDEETLIAGCSILGNQIVLDRVKAVNGSIQEASQEQIVSGKGQDARYNSITPVITENYQTIQQVELKNKIDISTLKHVKAKEVFYENRKSISAEAVQPIAYCSVHNPWNVVEYTVDFGEAMRIADGCLGYAMDADGALIWQKAATATKNQIMAIELETESAERDSKTICMDIMLRQIGSPRDTAAELAAGKTCQEILESAVEDYVLMDITGSSLEGMLYYINQDIPIMVLYEDGDAVLITGFNQFNIVVMDPVEKKLGYMSRSDAKEMLAETENQVFTYYRKRIN